MLDSKVFNWKMFEKMVGLPLNNLSLLNQKEEIETLLELFRVRASVRGLNSPVNFARIAPVNLHQMCCKLVIFCSVYC